jgi:hypothetical protein
MQRELKFVMRNERAGAIAHWLRLTCRPDPAFAAGTVSSIYFDTYDWRFLREKIDSDYHKTKVRVRWYSDIENLNCAPCSFVEAKFRTGACREKTRIQTNAAGAWLSQVDLNDPALSRLPERLRALNPSLPFPLRAVLVVAYRRLRFVEPTSGLRISVDFDIAAPRVNCQAARRSGTFRLRQAVLEVKGEAGELPDALKPITEMGLRRGSFSKYESCCRNLMGGLAPGGCV